MSKRGDGVGLASALLGGGCGCTWMKLAGGGTGQCDQSGGQGQGIQHG